MSDRPRSVVDRSIERVRLLLLLVGGALLLRGGLNSIDLVSIGLLLLALLASLVERLTAPRIGAAAAATITVAVDTVAVVAILGIQQVTADDAAALLLLLPLLEAAFRLGLLATAAVWFVIAFATATRLVVQWNGSTAEAASTAVLLALLLLVSLPAAHLTTHLVELVASYHRAREVAERRARILTALLDASSGMATLDADAVLRTAVEAAAGMVEGRAVITGSAPGRRTTPTADVPGPLIVLADSGTTGVGDPYVVDLDGRRGAVALAAIGPASTETFVRDGLELLGAHLRVALSNVALDEQNQAAAALWERRAVLDSLTGLPNRRALMERLDAWRDPAVTITVLYIDLDGFKSVNDTHGHDAGDEVLIALAGRLTELAPVDGIVARLGGDEFVVAYPDGHGTPDALITCIVEQMSLPIALSTGDQVALGASVGAAVAGPRDARSADTLLAAADTRMYEHKRDRRATDRPRGHLRLAAPVEQVDKVEQA